MIFRFSLVWLTAGLLCIFGCSRAPTNQMVRDKVYKVTGTVHVDGQPVENLGVQLVRTNGPDEKAGTSKSLTPNGATDAQGKFAIGTYESGSNADGAPDGEYDMTFQWGEQMALTGSAGDKFYGKYSDPKKSEHKVTVAGKPVDLGVIELTTEGVVKPKTAPAPRGFGVGSQQR